MQSNYRIALAKGWQDVKARNPLEITTRLAVSFDAQTRQFVVAYLGERYALNCDTETIARESDGQVPDTMSAILMLNYLSHSSDVYRPSGTWVSLREIPNGGAVFYPAFLKNTIGALIAAFGGEPKKLLRAGEALGARPAAFGSSSVTLDVFPEFPLCFVVWEGDDEVPANATVLFDPAVAPLLHIECVIGAGMLATERLIQVADT